MKTEQSSARKKGGKGTHGSLTKAGKVRNTTPKVPATVKHNKLGPKQRNRRNYMKRIIRKREIGQNWKLLLKGQQMMVDTSNKRIADLAAERVRLKRILRALKIPFDKNESTDLLTAKVAVSRE